jgi:hypothetical protein
MSRNFNRAFRKIFHLLLLTGIFALTESEQIFADEALIQVKAEVDKSVITIGDRLHYILTIAHDKNLYIQQPGPGANLGMFEIKDYTIHDPIQQQEMITQQFDYEISVFDTGHFVIPPFPVAFAESDTSREYQIIQSEPLEIFVKSVLTAEDREIKDIKPPQRVPFNYKKWLQFSALVVIILAIIVFLLYWWRFRKKGVGLFRKEIIRPAHEVALEQLALLKEKWREMLIAGEHKFLFTQISEILRKYLENRFFIKALEETTSEISISMNEINIENEQMTSALVILEFSDLVKFAKYLPGEIEVENQLKELEDFILKSKLVFEKVEQKEEANQSKESVPTELASESTKQTDHYANNNEIGKI